MRYRPKRRYSWSPEIAYSVGLMASDGCLSSDGRHLDLTSKDIEQLENFCMAIGRQLHISLKNVGKCNEAYHVQFSDVAYYDFLQATGLTSAKSKTINVLNVPDEYYGHFLRGVFDGDGSVYGYHDPRWSGSFLYYTAFASASIAFLNYLIQMNRSLAGVKGSSVRVSSRVFNLVYGKADSLKLFHCMYSEGSDLFLARKKTKFEGFIKHDKDVTILRLNARVA